MLLTTFSLPVLAQSSFLGVSLTSPFPGEIHECPLAKGANVIDTNLVKEAGLCFVKEREEQYRIWNSPDIGIGHILDVETYDGKPLAFKMIFKQKKYAQAVETFTLKYGKPAREIREKVKTRAGEEFNSRVNIWTNSQNLSIRLFEIGNDVRWSDGVILNVPLHKEKEKKEKELASAAAKKM